MRRWSHGGTVKTYGTDMRAWVSNLLGAGVALLILAGRQAAGRPPMWFGSPRPLLLAGVLTLLLTGLAHWLTRQRVRLSGEGLRFMRGPCRGRFVPWSLVRGVQFVGHERVTLQLADETLSFGPPWVGWHELGMSAATAIGRTGVEAAREAELPRERLERWLGVAPGERYECWAEDRDDVVRPLKCGCGLVASAIAAVVGVVAICQHDPAVPGVPLALGGAAVCALFIAVLRRDLRCDGRRVVVTADGEGVCGGGGHCRWGEVVGVSERDGDWVIATDRANVALSRDWQGAAHVADVARRVLAARDRGVRAAGDPSVPVGALSRAEPPSDDAERGLSRVDAGR